jgi:hypothetical protein
MIDVDIWLNLCCYLKKTKKENEIMSRFNFNAETKCCRVDFTLVTICSSKFCTNMVKSCAFSGISAPPCLLSFASDILEEFIRMETSKNQPESNKRKKEVLLLPDTGTEK